MERRGFFGILGGLLGSAVGFFALPKAARPSPAVPLPKRPAEEFFSQIEFTPQGLVEKRFVSVPVFNNGKCVGRIEMPREPA